MVLHRKQHREEVVRLQQQLKSTSATSKGGAAEADRTKKDLEKTRQAPMYIAHLGGSLHCSPVNNLACTACLDHCLSKDSY